MFATLVLAFAVPAGLFGMSLLFDFAITANSVEVRLFRKFPLRRYHHTEITQVRCVTIRQLFSSGDAFARLASWKNRFATRFVILEFRDGRGVLLTPARPAVFAAEVQARITSLQSERRKYE